MEKVATDIYSFARIREEGFTYVDKTEELYAMASGDAGAQFFMARPRRFGKSLAVSTLKCLFEGRRELFQGLKIEPKWDWSKKWPVLHLDMGSAQTAEVPGYFDLVNSPKRVPPFCSVDVPSWGELRFAQRNSYPKVVHGLFK